MEELPLAAGLQLIDAELHSRGIPRIYTRAPSVDFDSLAAIDAALGKL